MDLDVSTHAHTMQKLEALKKVAENGKDYWLAREIAPILGYDYWHNFEIVVKKASTSLKKNGRNVANHIHETTARVTRGRDPNFLGRDYVLSRAACYLIAMNGESSKVEIAGAQAYFAIQTRRMEEQDAKSVEVKSEDAKRLTLRGKVTNSFKAVSRIASQVGVPSGRQGWFHDQRFKGLYGAGRAIVYQRKGLSPDEELLDRIGACPEFCV
jgi:DNA-damage-inducible protein D